MIEPTNQHDPHDPIEDLLAPPPERAVRPVRPAALDRPTPGGPIPGGPIPVDEQDAPVKPPARESKPRAKVAESAQPCGGCGYDLRGLPSGGRCPECGTRIPKRVRKVILGDGNFTPRADYSGAWRSFGPAALAPIGLLTPLPYALPFGVGLAVALGFAPLFRLHALKRLADMPDAVRAPVAAQLSAQRRWQLAETALVALVAAYAVVATFAFIPAAFVPAYQVLLMIWWLLAIQGVIGLVTTGHAFAATLVDPSALPPIGRFVRAGRIAQACGASGFIFAALGAHAFDSGTTEATAAAVLMVLLLVVAAALGGYACLMAFGHATMVAECIFESESLGAPSRTPVDDPAAPFLETPEPKSTRAQSDGRPAWEDDDPVPLA